MKVFLFILTLIHISIYCLSALKNYRKVKRKFIKKLYKVKAIRRLFSPNQINDLYLTAYLTFLYTHKRLPLSIKDFSNRKFKRYFFAQLRNFYINYKK